jgi:hypothetical protein
MATHAVLFVFRIDAAKQESQLQGLRDFIVPGVREEPGFVAGYWTVERDSSETVTFVLFESRVFAERFAKSLRKIGSGRLKVGTELMLIRVVEVVATA